MMQQAVDCARYGDPAPPNLRSAWDCQRWHTLPEDGGYYDQDYGLMKQMSALQNIHGVVSKVSNLRGKQIHQLTTSDRRLLRFLRDNKLWQ